MQAPRLKILYVGRDGVRRRRLAQLLSRAGYLVEVDIRELDSLGPEEDWTFGLLVTDHLSADGIGRLREGRKGPDSVPSTEVTVLTAQLREMPRARRQDAGPKKDSGRASTASMNLRRLRETGGRTQGEIAHKTSMSQPQLSRFEARKNHLTSTLRKYVRALGGRVEVIAVIDGTRITLEDV
jgi:CheY-like chemotaxis protein